MDSMCSGTIKVSFLSVMLFIVTAVLVGMNYVLTGVIEAIDSRTINLVLLFFTLHFTIKIFHFVRSRLSYLSRNI